MKKITLTSAAIVSALSLGSTPSMAADSSWAGAYGGLSVGYDDVRLSGVNGGTLNYYGVSNPNPNIATVGADVGYNYQMPQSSVVTGVEASLDFGLQDGMASGTAHPSAATAKVPYDLAVKARLGYAEDKFLPYIETGPVLTETEFRVTALDGTDLGDIKTSIGWQGGVGVDYMLQKNIFLSAEYSYTWLPSEDYLRTPGEHDRQFDLNTFKIGVGYKF